MSLAHEKETGTAWRQDSELPGSNITRISPSSNKEGTIKIFIEEMQQAFNAKKALRSYREAVENLVEIIGLDHYFQSDDGATYKIETSTEKSLGDGPYRVKSTRLTTNPSGQRFQRSLSLKEARQSGI